MLIYDIEIIKAIPPKKESERIPGIEYCSGWDDHKNMGVACIGAYDYHTDKYRMFYKDNFDEFYFLCGKRWPLVGFNNIAFDNRVLDENNLLNPVPDQVFYDILVETWAAIGIKPPYSAETHSGYGLNALCEANFGHVKTGNGAMAPIWFQQGKIGLLTDYCLNDVFLTKQLMDKILKTGFLINPRDKEREIIVYRPRP